MNKQEQRLWQRVYEMWPDARHDQSSPHFISQQPARARKTARPRKIPHGSDSTH